MGDPVRINRPLVPPTTVPTEETNVLKKTVDQLLHATLEGAKHRAIDYGIRSVELAAEVAKGELVAGFAKRVLGPVGIAYAGFEIVTEFHKFMITDNISEGVTGTMLKLAQDDSPRGNGARAALVGYTAGELANVAQSYGPGSFKEAEFLDGAGAVALQRDKYPDGVADAERIVRKAFRSAEDGYAAGLMGWHPTTLKGDSVSEQAWDHATTDIAEGYSETIDLQARAYAGRNEGFTAARSGHVNAGRYDRDFTYRLGVRYFEDAKAVGSAEVERRGNIVAASTSVKVPAGSTLQPVRP